MRPKPKYKIGDLLEHWTRRDKERYYYLVIDIYVEKCGNPKCRNCPNRLSTYKLKDMKSGEVESWDLYTVDMLGWGGSNRLCYRGWRKVI